MEGEKVMSEWISVKDKLPDDTYDCLVWTVFPAAKEYNVAFLSDEGWLTTEQDWNIDMFVTHWMQLPEPPK